MLNGVVLTVVVGRFETTREHIVAAAIAYRAAATLNSKTIPKFRWWQQRQVVDTRTAGRRARQRAIAHAGDPRVQHCATCQQALLLRRVDLLPSYLTS